MKGSEIREYDKIKGNKFFGNERVRHKSGILRYQMGKKFRIHSSKYYRIENNLH